MYGSKTKKLLRRFEVGSRYRGYQYCAYSVNLVIDAPDRLTSVTKGIYPDVAQAFGTSIDCVERNIRTVVERVWKKGGQEFFYHTSGERLERRPSNAKFLEMLVNYIIYEERAGGLCLRCNLVTDYKEQITKLEAEVKRLNEMVAWMHVLIQKLLKEGRDIT